MIAHDPRLVILSITVAVFGTFTTAVLVSNLNSLTRSERGLRIGLAVLALGGTLWATLFVGILALQAPLNLTQNPGFLGASAVAAFAGSAAALLQLGEKRSGYNPPLMVAVAVLGLTIFASNYFGLIAVTGQRLRISWFLAAMYSAYCFQLASLLLAFLDRRHGVGLTLGGSVFLGLGLAAAHYFSVQTATALQQTLASVPRYEGEAANGYLAWTASIVVYLVCSICLCIFAVQQFREELRGGSLSPSHDRGGQEERTGLSRYNRPAALKPDPSGSDRCQRHGVKPMFEGENARGKPLLVIVTQNRDNALSHDSARIHVLADEMHGCARDAHPGFKRLPLRMQTAKRRQQGGVDIQLAAAPFLHEGWRMQPHEACIANKVHASSTEFCRKRCVEGFARLKGSVRDGFAGDPILPGAFKTLRVLPAREHKDDIGRKSRVLRCLH